MRWETVILSAFFAILALAQQKPAKVALSTWLREDLFAGFMANDQSRFDNGVKKLDAYQEENPNSGEAMAWRGLVEMVRAVHAREAGNNSEYQRYYDRSVAVFERAGSTNGPDRGAVTAITGGTFIALADRMSEKDRHDAYERAYNNYTALKQGQAQYFDKLPVHMRGEVLAGLAQSAQRLGKTEESNGHLAAIASSLAGTPYATAARKWADNPKLANTTSIACQTCHDAGRLNMSELH